MINLAARDIGNQFGRYILSSLGLGLLLGVTMIMAGVYRGMVDDGKALINSAGADLWVVQKDTLGPYAEPSSLHDDVYRSLLGLPGVEDAANVTYLTMQIWHKNKDVRVMINGIEPGGGLGSPQHLIAGRPVLRSHYEAVVDIKTGFQLGEKIRIRRNDYTVVGITKRMVSSGGDPMVFVAIKDAQEIQFLKDSDAIANDRDRLAANPLFNRPNLPDLLPAIESSQFSNHNVNAVLVKVRNGWDEQVVADNIKQWKRLQAYTKADMEEILVVRAIGEHNKQIGMFLVILSLVSALIVAMIIYTMTMDKIKEIAVLKLIGTPNRTIAGMILQESLGLGLIGFTVGKLVATLAGPAFPKNVLLLTSDAELSLVLTLVICALASLLGIRAALRVDPASAIGGN